MAKEKIMISGAMSSDPIRNRGHFHAAATMLRTVNTAVLNPAALPEGLSEPEYMQICLAFVQVADTIYIARWLGTIIGRPCRAFTGAETRFKKSFTRMVSLLIYP